MEKNAPSQPAPLALWELCAGSRACVVESGVERGSVDPDLGLAVVVGTATIADLITATEAAGYGARPAEEPEAERKEQ